MKPARLQDGVLSEKPRPEPWLLMGPPSHREETQRLACSLLGPSGKRGGADLSPVLCVGLEFKPGEDPVKVAYELLERAGFASPEQLRAAVRFPRKSMVCVPSSKVVPLARAAGGGADLPFLSAAFVLGLCTATFYNPARPVIWTAASLTRRVRLFTLGGFYGNA